MSTSDAKPPNLTKEKPRIKGQDQGNLQIKISPNPVLRFAPEPSGYLHLGHAKASLLNLHFSTNGHLRVRFDDTNPLKETLEFEESIIQDLSLIGITNYHLSRSTDYMKSLTLLAIKFLQSDLAYADNTPVDKMREERDAGIPNQNRSNSPQRNLEIFSGMQNKENQDYCLRAKIDIKNKNKSLRDPVIFRFNFSPHYVYKNDFFLYPTYDFACPLIDSFEGISDVFRSNEYRDRNAQYAWFIEKAFSLKISEEEILSFVKCEKKEKEKILKDYLFLSSLSQENEEIKEINEVIKEEFKNMKINEIKETEAKEINEINEDEDDNKGDEIKEAKEIEGQIKEEEIKEEVKMIIRNYYTLKTKPGIVDFSRMSFENTILSKRNLKEIIKENNLSWDDPRIPTLRGIKRRGLSMAALKEYILMQGVAQKTSIFSWDKLWALNKKIIDENAGRYFCVEEKYLKEFEIKGGSLDFGKRVPLHRKNPSLGEKDLFYGKKVYLDKRDVALIGEEEFTLMYFSTAVIKGSEIHLTEGDVRKPKNKISWVSKQNSVRVKMVDFMDLLKNDQFNVDSKVEEWGVAEEAVLGASGFVQFERVGHFYVEGKGVFHLVPCTAQQRKY